MKQQDAYCNPCINVCYNLSMGVPLRRALGAAAVLTVALLGLPVAAGAAPTCLTPVAADGAEPPCNPFLASPVWGGSHRASYAQASTPFPGPRAGDAVRHGYVAGVLGVPLIIDFTEPYADGGRAAWFSTVATPDGRYVYKVDVGTGQVISGFGFFDDPQMPSFGGVSGAYNVLDRDNHLVVGRGRSIDVYGDAVPGDRFSKIALLKHFAFPDAALCGPDDTLVGITMLFDGRIAFASQLGVVGTLPREPERMRAQDLVTTSINGDRCTGASADDRSLDQVSNSIAADEHGGIYVVTSQAIYRYDWDGTRVTLGWRAAYAAGGTSSSVRIGDGSGSTPTLMGTGPGQDRFVVITDGQRLVHLDLFWRDEIPADWKGLPGKDRRLACEVPVTFGDANATESQNEQSVLVRGYGAVVPNNQLRDDSAFASLSGNPRQLAAALAGGDRNNAPHGLERIDWDPKTRTCRTRWANREVSLPNGIPSMSTASGLIYGIGQRDGTWGLEGIDFDTGVSRLRVDTTSGAEQNSAYAATTVGPNGTIWTGNIGGYTVFRGPVRPEPALACLDITPPTSTVRARLSRTRLRVSGRARDRACEQDAPVARVQVSVARRTGPQCRALTRRGRLAPPRPCAARTWLPARLRPGGGFVLARTAKLPTGRYAVAVRAVDRRGNAQDAPTRSAARVR